MLSFLPKQAVCVAGTVGSICLQGGERFGWVSPNSAEEIWGQGCSFVLCLEAPRSSTARQHSSGGRWPGQETAKALPAQ